MDISFIFVCPVQREVQNVLSIAKHKDWKHGETASLALSKVEEMHLPTTELSHLHVESCYLAVVECN